MIKSIFKLLTLALTMIGLSLPAFADARDAVVDDAIIHAPQDDDKGADEAADDKDDDDEGLPLKPERKIEFETDEGTWLALDVSPDGETIIFELLGDIYTMPAAGGEATALITGMGFQSQPNYSPDGKNITFLSDESGAENVHVVGIDGESPRKLSSLIGSEVLSPEWSADSQYIYVSQNKSGIGAMGLWMYHKDGGKGIEVIKTKETPDTPRNRENNIMGVSASSDGRYLYYAKKQGGFSYNMSGFSWSVVRHDLIEGTTSTIVTAQGGAIRPEVSPDGNTLIYGTRYETETGLRVRDLTSGEDRWLAYPVTHDDQESRSTRDLLPSYSFTPDGQAIILNVDGKISKIALNDGTAENIPFNAKVNLDIGPDLIHQKPDDKGPVVVRMAQAGKLSPDGTTVVFSALGELYTMELIDGGVPEKLDIDATEALMPNWSSGGRWITYVTWGYDGGHVWKIRPNGRSNTQITQASGYYTEPVFSPNDEEIVAVRTSNYQFNIGNPDTQRDLIVLPADGGDARVILPGSDIGSPHFGNAVDRVYLYNNSGLYSVRLDGTDRRDHLQVKGRGYYSQPDPVPAGDMRISPDGKWALAKSQQQLHLVSIPQLGKISQTVIVSDATVPLKTLSDIGVDYFDWSDDGNSVLWSVGSTFYTQDLSTIDWTPPEDDDEDKSEDAEEEKEDEPKKYQTYTARIEVPRDNPEGIIVFRGATALTMGPKGIVENADIIVENGFFKAVGANGELDIPEDAEIRDMSGKYILPGYVDSHGHWSNWDRIEVKGTDHWPYLANLAYGITSGLDVQTGTTDIFVAQDMVESGRMIGIRPWSTGPGVFSDNAFKDKEHALNVLTRYRDHYRTKNIKAYISGNRKQRQYIIEASKELGMMPTTEGGLDLKLDLTHVIDGFAGNEHNFPIHPLHKDVIELVAKSGIGYTPTMLVS
ncbi:MAG: amidohydrolase, partial [Kordiimonadaceae bacterium]|nr:amidohydrolase [Kordiimonadaceae bacterium]